jgi:hypothetical protein
MNVLLFVVAGGLAVAAEYKAGVARVVITPDTPIYMSGYANRTHPSEGKLHDLWAKALAIEDRKGGRVVIVTTDLIGLSRPIADEIATHVMKEQGLDRSRLVLNSSHTHTGPLIRGNLENLVELGPEHTRVVHEYSRKLVERIVAVVGAALRDLAPASLSFGNGTGSFAINRRENSAKGMRLGVNPKGPSDHDVPVLKIASPGGRLRAVLFGYACHNTTFDGSSYQISGDYSGYAQHNLEQAYPGASAMFLMLCGADQNPHPRGNRELAEQHGGSLANEVRRVLGEKLQTVTGGRTGAAFQTVDIEFAPHSEEQFRLLLQQSNLFQARNAKLQLRLYENRTPLRRYPYPAQAIRLGKTWTLVALGGEVVVDYALRIKQEYGSKGIVIAGYSNDVMSYIPSLRVLKEGGYEARDSMIYYGMPGPYSETVEERVMEAVRSVLKRSKR